MGEKHVHYHQTHKRLKWVVVILEKIETLQSKFKHLDTVGKWVCQKMKTVQNSEDRKGHAFRVSGGEEGCICICN